MASCLDRETALELAKKGGTLLLLDVPQFTLFGIDTQVFSVGPNFKGMKMLPPGPHFVYYCYSDKEGHEFSPTISFFITIHPFEIIVRKWCQKEERLITVSEEEECRYSEMVRQMEFDKHLGPYPLDHYANWKHLSCYISESTISRIEPVGTEISILKRGCFYTTIPKVVKQKNINGEELTALNLDKTKLLENILMRNFGGEEDLLLGELQFSFIAFMMGQSLEAFIQWKDLISLFFSCIEAPLRIRTQLFTKFIRVNYFQLKHGFHEEKGNNVDKGLSLFLDDDWFSKDVFLYCLCKEFFPLVLNAEVIDGDLLSWTKKLKKFLETTLGWDFVDNDAIFDEDDEFAPVVVPLNEAAPMSHDGQAS